MPETLEIEASPATQANSNPSNGNSPVGMQVDDANALKRRHEDETKETENSRPSKKTKVNHIKAKVKRIDDIFPHKDGYRAIYIKDIQERCKELTQSWRDYYKGTENQPCQLLDLTFEEGWVINNDKKIPFVKIQGKFADPLVKEFLALIDRPEDTLTQWYEDGMRYACGDGKNIESIVPQNPRFNGHREKKHFNLIYKSFAAGFKLQQEKISAALAAERAIVLTKKDEITLDDFTQSEDLQKLDPHSQKIYLLELNRIYHQKKAEIANEIKKSLDEKFTQLLEIFKNKKQAPKSNDIEFFEFLVTFRQYGATCFQKRWYSEFEKKFIEQAHQDAVEQAELFLLAKNPGSTINSLEQYLPEHYKSEPFRSVYLTTLNFELQKIKVQSSLFQPNKPDSGSDSVAFSAVEQSDLLFSALQKKKNQDLAFQPNELASGSDSWASSAVEQSALLFSASSSDPPASSIFTPSYSARNTFFPPSDLNPVSDSLDNSVRDGPILSFQSNGDSYSSASRYQPTYPIQRRRNSADMTDDVPLSAAVAAFPTSALAQEMMQDEDSAPRQKIIQLPQGDFDLPDTSADTDALESQELTEEDQLSASTKDSEEVATRSEDEAAEDEAAEDEEELFEPNGKSNTTSKSIRESKNGKEFEQSESEEETAPSGSEYEPSGNKSEQEEIEDDDSDYEEKSTRRKQKRTASESDYEPSENESEQEEIEDDDSDYEEKSARRKQKRTASKPDNEPSKNESEKEKIEDEDSDYEEKSTRRKQKHICLKNSPKIGSNHLKFFYSKNHTYTRNGKTYHYYIEYRQGTNPTNSANEATRSSIREINKIISSFKDLPAIKTSVIKKPIPFTCDGEVYQGYGIAFECDSATYEILLQKVKEDAKTKFGINIDEHLKEWPEEAFMKYQVGTGLAYNRKFEQAKIENKNSDEKSVTSKHTTNSPPKCPPKKIPDKIRNHLKIYFAKNHFEIDPDTGEKNHYYIEYRQGSAEVDEINIATRNSQLSMRQLAAQLGKKNIFIRHVKNPFDFSCNGKEYKGFKIVFYCDENSFNELQEAVIKDAEAKDFDLADYSEEDFKAQQVFDTVRSPPNKKEPAQPSSKKSNPEASSSSYTARAGFWPSPSSSQKASTPYPMSSAAASSSAQSGSTNKPNAAQTTLVQSSKAKKSRNKFWSYEPTDTLMATEASTPLSFPLRKAAVKAGEQINSQLAEEKRNIP